jgi:hypothetical protein
LLRCQIFDPDPVAMLDDFGDPAAMTMPVVALVAEDADGTGLLHQRRKLVEFFFRPRRLEMPGIDLVKRVELTGARGQTAVLWRTEPAQMHIGNAAFVEAGSELAL